MAAAFANQFGSIHKGETVGEQLKNLGKDIFIDRNPGGAIKDILFEGQGNALNLIGGAATTAAQIFKAVGDYDNSAKFY
jgi:hypothetical protein